MPGINPRLFTQLERMSAAQIARGETVGEDEGGFEFDRGEGNEEDEEDEEAAAERAKKKEAAERERMAARNTKAAADDGDLDIDAI